MNNKMTASAYPRTVAGPENIESLRQLQQAVEAHADPLEAWAAYNGYSDKAMSKLLGCPLEVYKLHVATRGVLPHSPLEPKHVLRFCIQEGIHPADLAPKQVTPEHACPTYIFEAIKFLSEFGTEVQPEDRLYAAASLNLEQQRYERFVQSVPAVETIFDDVEGFVRSRRSDQEYLDDTVRAIGFMPNTQASKKAVLQACFRESAHKIEISDPVCHIEDYHIDMLAKVEELKLLAERLKKEDRYKKEGFKEFASHLFGKESVGHLLDVTQSQIKLFDSETDFSPLRRVEVMQNRFLALFKIDVEGIQELKDKKVIPKTATPEQCVRVLVRSGLDYFSLHQHVDAVAARAHNANEGRLYFERWIKNAQMPELFYMQYLYCNRALDMPAPHNTVPATDLSQRFDPT